MSNPVFLSLVFHNHQAVGNFDFVNQRGYEVAYLPIVTLLERHPSIRVGMHFSGSLLEWLAAHEPDFLARVKALVKRGQVEILTGGYYEPVLVALPDADKHGQIQKLTAAIHKLFDTEPKGVWLAERVWDPYLAKPLAEAGAQYAIVDDTHFEAVGFDKERDLFGYYVTEEQGHRLAVFPSLTHLRYSIPWGTVEDNINWLRHLAGQGDANRRPRLAFMADDGDKFGGWPGTWEHCWESGYMEAFFSAIEDNSEWLQTITPGDYMAEYPALGRAYLPTGSYKEMGEWSLPATSAYEFHSLATDLQRENNHAMLRYMRGGLWRNFMIKYEEINRMHKRALHISAMVHAMPEGPDKTKALDHLWAAQSNDAYWHGLFGGIYLFHFRVENYANLIAAEMLAEGANPPLVVEKRDVNLDLSDELVLRSRDAFMIFDLSAGGAIKEWDHRPAKYNLLNLMTRRDEGYHQDLLSAAAENRLVVVDSDDVDYDLISANMVPVKEAGIEHYLIADWYCRGSFVDHFLRQDASLEGFYRSAYPEQGDFVNQPYEAEWDVKDDVATIHLHREGFVWMGEHHLPVRVTKVFKVAQGENKIEVQYTVRNLSDQAIDVRFGVETALAYDGGDNSEHCAFHLGGQTSSLADVAEHENVTAYSATTTLRGLQTDFTLSQPSNIWRFPLETVTLSEAGYERGYQGTAFLQWWPLELAPGEEWQIGITMAATMLD
jgi:hypothetical protein